MANKNKFESNKKYFTISIYTIVVILIGCVIFRFVTQWATTQKLISDLWKTLSPFFMGFLIAYIMNPVVSFFQRNIFDKVFKEKRLKFRRSLSILLSYLIMIGCVIICLQFIIPQLYESIRELSLQIPDLYNIIVDLFEKYKQTSSNLLPPEVVTTLETKTLPKLMNLSNNILTELIPWIYNASLSLAKLLFNIFIAFVVSIYMTTDKQLLKTSGKRLILAVFNEDTSYVTLRTLRDCHNIFSNFIIGKSIDSLIIGLLCFAIMTLLKLPYTVLISVIVGITNMIPYFGPFIGAVPGSLILLIVSPMKAFIFLIMILVLQQFDGLILGPKILGDSTGVRPLLILFSITIGGEYFGPLGMFLGVPFFATIQYLVENWINYRLYKKKIDLPKEEQL